METNVYTILYNDNLDSSLKCTKDECSCELYVIHREDEKTLNKIKDEINKPALYMLLDRRHRKAYIGETDDCWNRLNQHIVHKKFWKEAFVFVGSRKDVLSKTEVQYLEYLAIEKARTSERYDTTENSQSGKKPNMGDIIRNKTEKFFDNVLFFTRFVGCDIFMPIESSDTSLGEEESDYIPTPTIKQDTSNNLDKYLEDITSVKRGGTPNGVSNAKPVLLLTIIQSIENNTIKDNKIYYDSLGLKNLYKSLYSQYVPDRPLSPMYMPFFYMSHDPFFHLQWKESGFQVSSPTDNIMINHLDYAYFDRELWNLLSQAEYRNKIKEAIQKKYF